MQSRSRDCNEAEHGGSTAICTTAATESQACNTNGCRKLKFHFVVYDFLHKVHPCNVSLRSTSAAFFKLTVTEVRKLPPAKDASWAGWGSWGTCTKACGGGVGESHNQAKL